MKKQIAETYEQVKYRLNIFPIPKNFIRMDTPSKPQSFHEVPFEVYETVRSLEERIDELESQRGPDISTTSSKLIKFLTILEAGHKIRHGGKTYLMEDGVFGRIGTHPAEAKRFFIPLSVWTLGDISDLAEEISYEEYSLKECELFLGKGWTVGMSTSNPFQKS